MPTPRFIIICREAFLEAGTNNLNLIRIFSSVAADRFPYPMPPFALVVNFDIAAGGTHTLHTELTGPEGQRIAQTDLPVKTNAGNWQVIANFEHLQFPVPGAYTFHISLDGEPLGTASLTLTPAVARASKKPALA